MPKINLSLENQEFILNDIIESLYSDTTTLIVMEDLRDYYNILESKEHNSKEKIRAAEKIQHILSDIKIKLHSLQGKLLNPEIVLQEHYIENGWIASKENTQELIQLFNDVLEAKISFYQLKAKEYEIENICHQCEKIYAKESLNQTDRDQIDALLEQAKEINYVSMQLTLLLEKTQAEKLLFQKKKFEQLCSSLASIFDQTILTHTDISKAESLVHEATALSPQHGRVKYFQWKLAADKAFMQNTSREYASSTSLLESAILTPEDFPEKNGACIRLLELKKAHEGEENAKLLHQTFLQLNLLRTLTEKEQSALDAIFAPISNLSTTRRKNSENLPKKFQKKEAAPPSSTDSGAERTPQTEQEKLALELENIRQIPDYKAAIRACLVLMQSKKALLEEYHYLQEVYLILAENYSETNLKLTYENFKKAAEQILKTPEKMQIFEVIKQLHDIGIHHFPEDKQYMIDLCKRTVEQMRSLDLAQTASIFSLESIYKISQANEQHDDTCFILKKILEHQDFLTTYSPIKQIHIRWNYAYYCKLLGSDVEAEKHYQLVNEAKNAGFAHKILARMALGIKPEFTPLSLPNPRSIFSLVESQKNVSELTTDPTPLNSSEISEAHSVSLKNSTTKEIELTTRIQQLTTEIERFSEGTGLSYASLLLQRNDLCLQLINESNKNVKYYQHTFSRLIHTSSDWILETQNNCLPEEKSAARFQRGNLFASMKEISCACEEYKLGMVLCKDKKKVKDIEKEITLLEKKIKECEIESSRSIEKIQQKIRRGIVPNIVPLSFSDSRLQFERAKTLQRLADHLFNPESMTLEATQTIQIIADAGIKILSEIQTIYPADDFDFNYALAYLNYIAYQSAFSGNLAKYYSAETQKYFLSCLENLDKLPCKKREEILSHEIINIYLILGQLNYTDKHYSLALKYYQKAIESQGFDEKIAETSRQEIYHQCMMIAESLKQKSDVFLEALKKIQPQSIRPLIFTLSEEAEKKSQESAPLYEILELYHNIFNIIYDNERYSTHYTNLVAFERIIDLGISIGDYDNAMRLAKIFVDLALEKKEHAEQHAPILCQYTRLLLRDISDASETEKTEKFKHAEAVLLRAIEIAPHSTEVCFELGWLYQAASMTEKADAYYQQVLDREQLDGSQKYTDLVLDQKATLEHGSQAARAFDPPTLVAAAVPVGMMYCGFHSFRATSTIPAGLSETLHTNTCPALGVGREDD